MDISIRWLCLPVFVKPDTIKTQNQPSALYLSRSRDEPQVYKIQKSVFKRGHKGSKVTEESGDGWTLEVCQEKEFTFSEKRQKNTSTLLLAASE